MKELLIFGAAVALLAGCATTKSTGNSDGGEKSSVKEKVGETAKKAVEASKDAVVTGDWELKLISGNDKQEAPSVTMTVTDAGNNRYTLQGFSGVNTFSCGLTIGFNGAISMDQKIATTRVGGSADAMAAEQSFLDALKAAASWKAVRVGVETLEMKGPAKTLRFVRLSIADRIWNLEAQADEKKTAIISIPEGGRKITLMIAKGKANVFTGLNITNTECTLDETARTISIEMASGAMTLASGSAQEMEQERLYLNNLADAASYTVSGKTLSVQNASGKTVLVFTAQDLI